MLTFLQHLKSTGTKSWIADNFSDISHKTKVEHVSSTIVFLFWQKTRDLIYGTKTVGYVTTEVLS
jgi:hypothetical protein